MKAIFPGSFHPFTIGHKSIADRALRLFGNLVIAVGYNESKPAERDSVQQRVDAIRAIYAGNEAVEVKAYSSLTADFARQCGASVIIRGVRNVADFEYERNMADINRTIAPDLETIFLPTSPEMAAVSSSVVRELSHFGYDISRFIPKP